MFLVTITYVVQMETTLSAKLSLLRILTCKNCGEVTYTRRSVNRSHGARTSNKKKPTPVATRVLLIGVMSRKVPGVLGSTSYAKK